MSQRHLGDEQWGEDAAIAEIEQHLVSVAETTTPRRLFLDEHLRYVQQKADSTPRVSRRGHRWSLSNQTFSPWVAMILVAAIVFTSSSWINRPQAVSASVVLKKAMATSRGDLPAVGVQTFHLKGRVTSREVAPLIGKAQVDTTTTTIEQWGTLPNRWRVDAAVHHSLAGRPDSFRSGGSDGTAQWDYVQRAVGTGTESQAFVGALLQGTKFPVSLSVVIPDEGGQLGTPVDLSMCSTPQIVREDTIAGRATLVLDLGAQSCFVSHPEYTGNISSPDSTVAPSQQERGLMWVDRATSFPLRYEQYDGYGNLWWQSEVTEIQYNIPIPDSIVAFSPPLGTAVTDVRPAPYGFPTSFGEPRFPGSLGMGGN